MLLEELVLTCLKHPRGHGLVLDAHIGQEGGGEPPLQVHGPQPLHIEGGNGVVALPQLLELRRREVPQGGEQRPVSGRNPGSPRGGRVSRSSRICLAGEMMIRMAASFWEIDPYKTGVCFIIIFSWEKTRKKSP